MKQTSGFIATLNLMLIGALGLPAQVFVEDFEAYAAGSVVAWDLSDGTTVVDESTTEAFGIPNKAAAFTGASTKLMKEVASVAVGQVTTFAADFVESAEVAASSGLILGYGVANEINTASAAVRVELRNGQIRHNTVGGLSSLTQGGSLDFEKGARYRLVIVVNDSDENLVDYNGEEDLPAGSFEVWLDSLLWGLQHVLEATIARAPEYAGFRTWSSYDGLFYIDNVRVDSGAVLESARSFNCRLTPGQPAVLSGATVTLEYLVDDSLPDGATFEIEADGSVVFGGTSSGPASTGGTIQATVSGDNRAVIPFTITFRDAEGEFLCASSVNVVVFNYTQQSEMVQPSIPSTQTQLEDMRVLVNNFPSSIARAGWDAMRRTPYASLGYQHNPQETVLVVPSGTNSSERAFRSDGQAARAHALQWVVTGDAAHRDKAMEILNDWGHAFRDIASTGSSAQTELESAWALPVWLSAADILRYYNDGAAGWDPADMADFNYFMEVLYRRAIQAFSRNNNWGASASFAAMAYGAWVGDEAVFQDGLDNQLKKLDLISEPDGEIAEVCRDTWHPQYTVVTWGDSAELAFNQGRDDLYSATFDGQDIPRLAGVLEYFANLMLGNTQPPCEAGWAYNYVSAFNKFDNYEVPYNHYINRNAVDYLPAFALMVEDHWRHDVGEDAHFLLWSRLTHGTNLLGDTVRGHGLLNDFEADANRWIDTGDWLGWVNDFAYPWLYQVDLGWLYMSPVEMSWGGWFYIPR